MRGGYTHTLWVKKRVQPFVWCGLRLCVYSFMFKVRECGWRSVVWCDGENRLDLRLLSSRYSTNKCFDKKNEIVPT